MSSEMTIGAVRIWIEDDTTVGAEMTLPGLGYLCRAFYGFLAAKNMRSCSASGSVGGDLRLLCAVERRASPVIDIGDALVAIGKMHRIVEIVLLKEASGELDDMIADLDAARVRRKK